MAMREILRCFAVCEEDCACDGDVYQGCSVLHGGVGGGKQVMLSGGRIILEAVLHLLQSGHDQDKGLVPFLNDRVSGPKGRKRGKEVE